jgi:hypothetical protein
MRRERLTMGGWRKTVLFATAGALLLGACRAAPEEEEAADPASVEHVQGTDLNRVTLSEDGARRLGIETAEVAEGPSTGGRPQMVIPYAAVVYDETGATWTYVSPEHLVFVRAPIEVETIEGDLALLSAGPDTGTPVVTVGAAELYGAEYGVEE